MKVQSTGLGKTVMLADFKELLNTEFENQQVLQLTMESTEPLHWTIKVYMEPNDLRRAIVMGLKPSVLWKALLAVVSGRFSFFKKPQGDRDDAAVTTKISPVKSSNEPTRMENRDTPGPLAGLKDPVDEGKASNPLAKLKG